MLDWHSCQICYPLEIKILLLLLLNEPPHDKTNKMTFAPSEDSDQPGHPPNLIRSFSVRSNDS